MCSQAVSRAGLTRQQVAAVLRGLADHTALMAASDYSQPEDGFWPVQTSIGRWLHDTASQLEHAPGSDDRLDATPAGIEPPFPPHAPYPRTRRGCESAEDVCSCRDHRDRARTTVGVHNYRLDSEERGWRWRCSCGRRGQFTRQSPSVAYHGWLRHTDRSPTPIPELAPTTSPSPGSAAPAAARIGDHLPCPNCGEPATVTSTATSERRGARAHAKHDATGHSACDLPAWESATSASDYSGGFAFAPSPGPAIVTEHDQPADDWFSDEALRKQAVLRDWAGPDGPPLALLAGMYEPRTVAGPHERCVRCGSDARDRAGGGQSKEVLWCGLCLDRGHDEDYTGDT
jgi:hypothetical protein